MKPPQIISTCILLVPLAFVGGYSLGTAARVPPGQPEVEAYFSPNGGCTAAVVRELDRARESTWLVNRPVCCGQSRAGSQRRWVRSQSARRLQ